MTDTVMVNQYPQDCDWPRGSFSTYGLPDDAFRHGGALFDIAARPDRFRVRVRVIRLKIEYRTSLGRTFAANLWQNRGFFRGEDKIGGPK